MYEVQSEEIANKQKYVKTMHEEEKEDQAVCHKEKEYEGGPFLRDILTDKRRRYETQQEFVYILYNDICENFVNEWKRKLLRKAVFSDKQNIVQTDECDNKDEVKEYYIDKDPKEWQKPDEYVEIEFANKNKYVGRVNRKMIEGDGSYAWRHGTLYKGQFEGNEIRGKGYLEWKDSNWYEGQFFNGYRHGTGIMLNRDYHCVYIGEWYIGQKHGKGYCRYNEKDTYDGDWQMGKRYGVGSRIYPSGARYIGHWKNDLRHGTGTMTWPNGDVYRGEWENGEMHGYGEYTWNGFFNKTLCWPQETCYMGKWQNGMRHGRGVLKFNSIGGAKYSGEWKYGKKHGRGVIFGNNGTLTEAYPLFMDNMLAPLNHGNEIPFQTEMSDIVVDQKIDSLVTKPIKISDPRSTTVFKPEQYPSIWFHLYRLLKPEYIWPLSITTIRSGKCHVHACEGVSFCFCLYKSPKILQEELPRDSLTSISSFVISLPSVSKFCIYQNRMNISPGNRNTQFLGLTEQQHEERWVHNCLVMHMRRLRKIYNMYAKMFCSEPPKCKLSMSRFILWQFWRDCGIHKKGISLVQIDRHLAFNKSIFIEEKHYPFEKIEMWQFLHALLEVSWHLYTKNGDVEAKKMRGQLAGGLQAFLTNDIFPNVGKHVGSLLNINRDLLPLYCVYRLYQHIGEPHTVRQLLRAMCIVKDAHYPKSLSYRLPSDASIQSFLLKGINVVTVGERISFLPKEEILTELEAFNPTTVNEDNLAQELLKLRLLLGVPKIINIMNSICPAIKDPESNMIIDMEYELTFLEFYEIILEVAKTLLCKRKAIQERKIKKLASEKAAAAGTTNQYVQNERSVGRISTNKSSTSKKKNLYRQNNFL